GDTMSLDIRSLTTLCAACLQGDTVYLNRDGNIMGMRSIVDRVVRELLGFAQHDDLVLCAVLTHTLKATEFSAQTAVDTPLYRAIERATQTMIQRFDRHTNQANRSVIKE